VPDFLAAAALAPERAEPLIWLCWHYHKRLDACAAADRVCHLQNRVAAFYYARAAAAVPYPPEVRRAQHKQRGPLSIRVCGAPLHHAHDRSWLSRKRRRSAPPRPAMNPLEPFSTLPRRSPRAPSAAPLRARRRGGPACGRGGRARGARAPGLAVHPRRGVRAPGGRGAVHPCLVRGRRARRRARAGRGRGRRRARAGAAAAPATQHGPVRRPAAGALPLRCAAPGRWTPALVPFSCAWLCPADSGAAAFDLVGPGASPFCRVRECWHRPWEQAA